MVVGVNDTLRCTFDLQAVAARLDRVYAAFTEQGALLLTACLPDPGTMLGLPGALSRPLARRQRSVNTVVHALSHRYGAVHLHAAEGEWTTDRAMWSADRLHPGERGHRQLASRFHALLAERGRATGTAPSPEPEFPVPTRSASLWWLATAGDRVGGQAVHRSAAPAAGAGRRRDTAPRAGNERQARPSDGPRGLDGVGGPVGGGARTGSRLGVRPAGSSRPGAARPAIHRRRTARKRTGVPGTAWAAAGRSGSRTTPITG